ncbi:11480_t:CDS:2 [Funneliformis geosporum]|uniref:2537_t:CDS:1 n=1 Tax=Funneliformis geosporum TaxID=1117311 RepID=A0A9W4SGQ2_9GLOM|nr:2537_t:CDS:2 [Funneliformis geosporum]CAI2171204.1 11480_t:CDS:2 [Funneliformis geosporum]
MEINSFSHNETRLLVINDEVVQITFKLHNESDISLYTEYHDLQEEIKQVIIAFVKFMDEDHIVDGEGYYLLCKRSIWNFGKNYIFYKNDQEILPHQYKYNFELEFMSQVVNRGKNKSITDSDKNNDSILREVSFEDNAGMPKSNNNAVNQEMLQHVTTRTNILPVENRDTRKGATSNTMNLRTPLLINRDKIQSFAENTYITPFDNQKHMQKPVDSAYESLFNYRESMEKNAYTTPIDNRGYKQEFENLKYSEFLRRSMANTHRTTFDYQEILDNVSGTLGNLILFAETFEQTSRESSQESFIRCNRTSQNSLESTSSLDFGSQTISGISKSQFTMPTKQISNKSYSTDDHGNDGEPLTQNSSSINLLNETVEECEGDNTIIR